MSTSPNNIQQLLIEIIDHYEFEGSDAMTNLQADLNDLVKEFPDPASYVEQYPIEKQLDISLALRNDIISTMAETLADDSIDSLALQYIGLWFGLSNHVQRYLNYLDPQWPSFDGSRVLDSFVAVHAMIEKGVAFLQNYREIPDYGDLMHKSDFDAGIRSGLFTDYDGSGYLSDGKRMWTAEDVHPSDFHIFSEVYPCLAYVIWFNK